MLYLACYDIDNNKLRLKVGNTLLAFGLERLQKSVFVGSLAEGVRQQLLKEVDQWLTDTEPDSVRFMLMPLAEAHTRKALWLGDSPPDWSYHTNQTLTLIV